MKERPEHRSAMHPKFLYISAMLIVYALYCSASSCQKKIVNLPAINMCTCTQPVNAHLNGFLETVFRLEAMCCFQQNSIK